MDYIDSGYIDENGIYIEQLEYIPFFEPSEEEKRAILENNK